MQACVAREEALRHEVATLRHALRCKDEQLWQLAATLTAHNVAMPTMGAAAPPAAPPREALWAAPLPEDVAAGSSLLEAAQASVAGPPAADSTVPLESDHGVTVGDLRDGGWACPTGGQASTTPSGSQTARARLPTHIAPPRVAHGRCGRGSSHATCFVAACRAPRRRRDERAAARGRRRPCFTQNHCRGSSQLTAHGQQRTCTDGDVARKLVALLAARESAQAAALVRAERRHFGNGHQPEQRSACPPQFEQRGAG
jgi:hypothetical protein